jgi:hypothetical protein
MIANGQKDTCTFPQMLISKRREAFSKWLSNSDPLQRSGERAHEQIRRRRPGIVLRCHRETDLPHGQHFFCGLQNLNSTSATLLSRMPRTITFGRFVGLLEMTKPRKRFTPAAPPGIKQFLKLFSQ